jgi:hypothetical protein
MRVWTLVAAVLLISANESTAKVTTEEEHKVRRESVDNHKVLPFGKRRCSRHRCYISIRTPPPPLKIIVHGFAQPGTLVHAFDVVIAPPPPELSLNPVQC